MDTRLEQKVLRDALEQLDDPDRALARQHKVKKWVYSTGSFGLLSALLLALGDFGPAWAAVLLGAASGIACGMAMMHEVALKQWPITMRHVDRDSVATRLEKLEGEDQP